MSCFSPCDSRTDGVLRLYLNRALWGYPKLVDMVFGSEALHTAREERKKEGWEGQYDVNLLGCKVEPMFITKPTLTLGLLRAL